MKSSSKALYKMFCSFVAQHIRYKTERIFIILYCFGMHVYILSERIIKENNKFHFSYGVRSK